MKQKGIKDGVFSSGHHHVEVLKRKVHNIGLTASFLENGSSCALVSTQVWKRTRCTDLWTMEMDDFFFFFFLIILYSCQSKYCISE